MPVVHLKTLVLDDDYIVVRPLKGDMATEKKYDRHGFGELVAGDVDAKPGDIVVYDDSNAIEIPLELDENTSPETVEVIRIDAVKGIDRIVSKEVE